MRRRALTLLALALLCPASCGGGGGGGGAPVGPTGFTVAAVEPRADTQNQSDSVEVRVFFSLPVEGASVGEGSFYVVAKGAVEKHPGSRSVSDDGYRVGFTPDPYFAVSTDYEVHVTAAVRSRDGRTLAEEFVSEFRTGQWASPQRLRQEQFRVVPNPMVIGRSRHTATTLPTSPSFPVEYVLLAGGYRSGAVITPSSELFDPEREDFLPSGNLLQARANHTATLVPGGFVLVAGGERLDPDGVPIALATTEYYAVATGTFTTGPSLAQARSVHTATTLPDGRILFAGGDRFDEDGYPEALTTAEIFEPSPFPGRFVPTTGEMEVARSGHQATLLADGRVLLTGGSASVVAEIFDPATNRFSRAKGRMAEDRWRHGAVALPTGRVLVAGGGDRRGELFDPAAGSFSSITGADSTMRYAALHLHFRPGEVLIVGGFEFLPDGNILLHAGMDHYYENYGSTGAYFAISAFPPQGVYIGDPRAYSAASRLSDGRFLITGGLGPAYEGPELSSAVLFDPLAP